jgi:hypothetical protein
LTGKEVAVAMNVLVGISDEETAADLVAKLERDVDAAEIQFEAEPRRLCIVLKAEPDRNLSRILNVVEEWLGEDGREPTKVEIDGHSYTLAGRA